MEVVILYPSLTQTISTNFTSYNHKEPMGGGTGKTVKNVPDKEWIYPHPNSPGELILKSVCKYAK